MLRRPVARAQRTSRSTLDDVGWIDLVLIVLVIGAVVNGLRLGAMVQVLSFVGFWVGLALGVGLSLVLARPLGSGWGRVLLTLVLCLGLGVGVGVAGSVLGRWGSVTLKRLHLGAADAAVGAAIGALSVLLSAWLIAGFVVQAQAGWFSSAVGNSAVLRGVDSLLPPVPSALAEVQSLLSQTGFPSVFAGAVPPAASPASVPSTEAARAIGATVATSVVKVLSPGCGGWVEGTAFVVAPGMVATNAHVIAGVRAPSLLVGGRSYAAVPVVVEPGLDLAILRTGAPIGPPLAFAPQTAPRGTQGAVVGYPENGPQVSTAAAVNASFTAVGRDIYGGGLVTRDVYELSADILPGDSGSPVVTAQGQVLGVVFSRSTVSQGVGYALTAQAVAPAVAQARSAPAAVSTGSCPPG
jgi:S1-C subfamily serine protease